ncbi:MAG: polysaccharide deacetylase family protein [Magnetococcales bacterium]|nr:polysaccharide deacetylase family protein [Magnetococcales bacterium]
MHSVKQLIKRLIRSVLAPFFHYSGASRLVQSVRRTLRPKGGVLILTYHRIVDPNGPDYTFVSETLGVHPNHFDAHMRHLKQRYDVVSLQEATTALRDNTLGNRELVVITFDDGYYDNYDPAWPILQKYGLPATIYLATDFLEDRSVMWNERLMPIMDQLTAKALDSLTESLPADMHACVTRYITASGQERIDEIDAFCQMLKRIPDQDKHALIDTMAALVPEPDIHFDTPLMMAWRHIQEMQDRGDTLFAAHSCSHPILSQVSSEQLEHELGESRKIIETRLNTPIHHFAYPNGGPNDLPPETSTTMQRHGYVTAVTQSTGINTPETDPFQLRRLPIGDYEISLFDLVLEARLLTRR